MLADREDIRRAQYFNGGRIVIMAEYPLEKTTDVPVRVLKHSFYQNVRTLLQWESPLRTPIFLKNGQINRVTKVSSTFGPTESDSEKIGLLP